MSDKQRKKEFKLPSGLQTKHFMHDWRQGIASSLASPISRNQHPGLSSGPGVKCVLPHRSDIVVAHLRVGDTQQPSPRARLGSI